MRTTVLHSSVTGQTSTKVHVASVARFGWLDSSNSSGIYSYACSLVHSELSWWGLKSSLHLHVAHMHYRSHYSVRSPYQAQKCMPGCTAYQMDGTQPCDDLTC
jgi:uncharacterized membrane protein